MSGGGGAKFPLLAWLWAFKLTPNGRGLVAAGLALSSMASASTLAPIYTVLFTLFALGLAAFVINLLHRPRLHAECAMPRRVVAGAEIHGAARVSNRGRGPALEVRAAFTGLPRWLRPEGGEVMAGLLRAGEEAELPLRMRAMKRGVYTLPPLRAFTTFPFNLLRSGAARTGVPPLTVLPRFTPASAVRLPATARYQPGGVTLTSEVGESPEYIGNREYRDGDSPRRLDTRAWARLARPVVREFQEEFFLRLALVVDTHIPRGRRPGPEGFPGLEAAVSLAATLADALSRGEYVIDIFAAGPQLYRFRTGRNTSSFDSVLDILAALEPCRSNPFDTLTPALAQEFATVSTLVCVLLDWDESRRALVRMAAEAGCRVKVFLVRDGAASLPEADMAGCVDEFVRMTPADVAKGAFDAL